MNKIFQCETVYNFISAGGSIHDVRYVRLLSNYFSNAAEIISVARMFLFQNGTTVLGDIVGTLQSCCIR